MAVKKQTLGEFIIENQHAFKYSSGELSSLLNSIRLAAKVVNHEVNKLILNHEESLERVVQYLACFQAYFTVSKVTLGRMLIL